MSDNTRLTYQLNEAGVIGSAIGAHADNTQDHDPEPLEPSYPPLSTHRTLPGRRPWKEAGIALAILATILGLGLILSCFACYAPDLSKTRYSCVEAAPLCPEGQACIKGWCGGVGPDGGAVVDMAAKFDDMAQAPLYTQGFSPGCASRYGIPLENGVYACPGTFARDPSGQCSPGYSVCMANKAPIGCAKVSACFISSARISPWGFPYQQDVVCQWTGSPVVWARGLGTCGCGGVPVNVLCGDFPKAYTCLNANKMPSGTSFTCPWGSGGDSDFTELSNTDAKNGVLCCPN